MNRRVFVVQDSPGKNLLPARSFGDIRIMLTHRDLTQGYVHVQQRLMQSLEDFDETKDYLLLIGDPIAMGLAIHMVLSDCGSVKLLKWIREKYDYAVEEVYDE